MKKYCVVKVDYEIKDNTPILLIRWRDEEGNCGIFTKDDFRPYFYAPPGEIPEDKKSREYMNTLDGKKVEKVFVDVPPDVPKEREKYSKTWESDILFPTRFMIDKGLKSGFTVKKTEKGNEMNVTDVGVDEIKLTRLYLDIETAAQEEGASDPNVAKDRIVSICATYYDPNEEHMKEFVFHDKNERKMLNNFLDVVEKYDPDCFVAWFAYFDLATILNRCKRVNADYTRLSPYGYVNTRQYGNREFFKCGGRLCLDLMEIYDNYYKNQTIDNLGLEHIANKEVNIEESDFDYNKLKPQNWPNHIDDIIEYNKLDVERMIKLDEQLNLINHFDILRRIIGCPYEDTFKTSKFTDTLMLREYNGEYVCPKKGHNKHVDGNYGGGYVHTPEPGIHEWIACLDFSAYYPTLIKAYNISPETLISEAKANALPDDKYVSIETKRGTAYFLKEPKGKLPQVFDEMEQYRHETKKERDKYDKESEQWELYDAKQYSLKQIIDCVPKGTKVLTKDGIKLIQDVEIGDKAWSMNDDGNYEWKPIVDKVKKESDKFVEINTSGSKFTCTPGHHMIRVNSEPEIVDAKELNPGDWIPVPNSQDIDVDGWNKNDKISLTELEGITDNAYLYVHTNTMNKKTLEAKYDRQFKRVDTSYYRTEASSGLVEKIDNNDYINLYIAYGDCKKQPVVFNKLRLARFLVWVVEKGNINNYSHCSTKSIEIKQENEQEHLEQLLTDMDIDFSKYKTKYTIHFSPLADYIDKHMHGARKFPEWVLDCNTDVAREIIEEAVITDGHILPNGTKRLNTSDVEECEQYCDLCVIAGYNHRKHEYELEDYDNAFSVYINNTPKSKYGGSALYKISSINVINKKTKNSVYDVTVADNHTLVWATDDRYFTTGQSIYGYFGNESTRFFIPKVPASTTAAGRKHLKETGEIAQKEGHCLLYGDSVTEDSPVIVKKDDKVDIVPINHLHNSDSMRDFDVNMQVWTGDKWANIKYVKKHDTNKQIYRVLYDNGFVDVTGDHSLIDKDGREVRPKDLEKGTKLYTSNTNMLPEKHILDKDLAWCLGLMASDGVNESKIVSKKDNINEFVNKWKYGIERINGETIKVKYNSLKPSLKRDISDCFNLKRKIPMKILNASKRAKNAFIRGYKSGIGTEDALISKSIMMGIYIIDDEPCSGEVLNVQEIDYDGPVYDISTDDEAFASGLHPIKLHNTDSVMIKMDVDNKDDAYDVALKMEDKANEYFKDFAKKEGLHQAPDLELEKINRRMFFKKDTKKRYAAHKIWEEGKWCDEISITGFAVVRSDRSQISKWAQKKLFEILLKRNDFKELHRFINEAEQKLREADDVKKVGRVKSIRKDPNKYGTPMTVHGVIWSNRYLGKNFGFEDTKPYIIHLKRMPPIHNDKLILEIPKKQGGKPIERKVTRIALSENDDLDPWKDYIDWDKHIQKQLKEKLEPILNSVGYSYDEVKKGHVQSTFDEF